MANSGEIRKDASFGYVTLQWEVESQDKSANTTTIFYKLYVQRNSTDFSDSTACQYSVKINGEFVAEGYVSLNGYGTKTVASGYTTIPHNADGSKSFDLSFSQYIRSGGYTGRLTASGTGILPVIDRLATLTVPDGGTLGSPITLTVASNSGLAHGITYKCGTASGSVCGVTTAKSITFTPPISLASQNTSGTSVQITFTITTYNEAQSLSYGSKTARGTFLIPSSVKPSCEIDVTDAAGWLDIFGAYVEGASKFSVNITPTKAYGSEVVAFDTTANGVKYKAQNFETDVLKSSGTLTISAKVTDQRSRSGSATKDVTVLDYLKPRISKLSVKRVNEDGTDNDAGSFCKATFTASITPLKNINTANYSLKYKKTTEDDFTEVPFSALDNNYDVVNYSYQFPADDGYSYDVVVTAIDKITEQTGGEYRATTLSTAFTLFHFGASGKDIGVGKISEEANPLEYINRPGLFDIGMVTRFNEPVCGQIAGLGRVPPIPENSDFNDYREIGCWAVWHTNIAQTIENMPVQIPGRLETISSTGKGIIASEWSYLRQKFTPYSLTEPVYERTITRSSSNEWTYGEWVATSLSRKAQKVLWTGDSDSGVLGGLVMNKSETITLSEPISKQANGIVLIFSRAETDGSILSNWAISSHFVPRWIFGVSNLLNRWHSFMMTTYNFYTMASKYLQITDTEIKGAAYNEAAGTGSSGIIYDNAKFVLRYVIGV